MCTAISLFSEGHYFGRNLDVSASYGEGVVIVPRGFPIKFFDGKEIKSSYRIMGTGIIRNNFPLLFDGINEKGLAVAGLSFEKECVYSSEKGRGHNIASYELIPRLLCSCESTGQAKALLLEDTRIIKADFDSELKSEPMHWLIGDEKESITLECTKEGIRVYNNKVGVLTNRPAFPLQMFNLNNYRGLSAENTANRFSERVCLEEYSKGMGAIGLPGDWSSMSRFVRAVFLKYNTALQGGEEERVSRFFQLLFSVSQLPGIAKTGENELWYTRYSCCYNTKKGVLYLKREGSLQTKEYSLNEETKEQGRLIFLQ